MIPIRRILLIGHTHHDVGYTNSPRLIDPAHAAIVRTVIELAERDANDDHEQFRWSFEVARPVLRFMSDASDEDVSRLRRLVAADRISITGGYLNMTQLPSDTEFTHAYDRLAALRAAGIPVRTEQHGDVNGIAWGAVTEMRHAGIDRLVMALNPDHGRAPFEQPTGFWWRGPTGERVFVWLSTHYGFGEEWGIIDGRVEEAESHIRHFIERLADRDDYPYETAIVHAANDNRWPTPLFVDVVRHWNTVHPEIPMATATIDHALDVVEAEARRVDIPVVHGEWSDWWSHGHGSTAREVAVYREARGFARLAQSSLALTELRGDGSPVLATVLGHRRGPVRLRTDAEITADLAHVDEQLLLFGEHTWGSWETYSKPHSTFSHSHWNAKAGFAYDAWDNARDLAVEGLYRLAASGSTTPEMNTARDHVRGLILFNPTERERSEAVSAEVDGVRQVTAVATVPAFGVSLVGIPESPREQSIGREISTDRYRAIVDQERGGLISLIDRRSGMEFVDTTLGHGLGAVVVETVAADSSHPMVTHDPKDFHPSNPGPDFIRTAASGSDEPTITSSDAFARIAWESTAPGVPRIRSTLTLYRNLDAIDLDVSMTKPESFEPESIFVAFPFAIDDATFLVETAGAVYEADAEQLPDTSKDWYSIQNAIGIASASRGVLWGSRDAPLVQLGGFHTGKWARSLEAHGSQINSWLMNNLHFTNFQARQEGTGTYRYRFIPRSQPIGTEEVRVFGRDVREPLLARQYEGPLALSGSAGLCVEPAQKVLAELRPDKHGTVLVLLRNITAEPVTATVYWRGDPVASESVELRRYGIGEIRLRTAVRAQTSSSSA